MDELSSENFDSDSDSFSSDIPDYDDVKVRMMTLFKYKQTKNTKPRSRGG